MRIFYVLHVCTVEVCSYKLPFRQNVKTLCIYEAVPTKEGGLHLQEKMQFYFAKITEILNSWNLI